ncbi:hypothetical protein Bca101_017910 [Brassica carinata]
MCTTTNRGFLITLTTICSRETNGTTLVRGTEEVPGVFTGPYRKGESEGGRWKSTSGQEAIMDKNIKVEGYKESFVYYKKVMGKEDKTGWVMTEYSFQEGVHADDLVLCYIRGKIEKKVKPNQVPKVGEKHMIGDDPHE